MKHIWLKGKNLLLLASAALFLVSCMEKFDDDYTWKSSVSNQQLKSPEKITPSFSADGTSQTVTWSYVSGAGGYEVTVYNVDEYGNRTVMGDSAQFVDGFSVTREAKEDNRYFIEVRTLGNEKMNNTEADSASTLAYNNFVPLRARITNANLTAYFKENPIPQDSIQEIAYELMTDVNYFMDSIIDVGGRDVSFRSISKVANAKIEIRSNGGFRSSGGTIRLQYLDINHTGSSFSEAYSLIALNTTPAPLELVEGGQGRKSAQGFTMIPVIALRGCEVTNIQGYLMRQGTSTKYAVSALVIEDCILGFGAQINNAFIEIEGGIVKDITITNSTLFNSNPFPLGDKQESNARLWRGAVKVGDVGGDGSWGSSSITLINNTFWQFGPRSQSGNGAFRARSEIRNNVLINSLGAGWGPIAEMAARNGSVCQIGLSANNTTWYDSRYVGFGEGDNPARIFENSIHAINGSEVTNNVAPIIFNPQFDVDASTYGANKPIFSMGASTQQVTKKTGDPRWLPDSEWTWD